jgi:GT2 family glycosyltransferase
LNSHPIPDAIAFRGTPPEPFPPLPQADPLVAVLLRTRDRPLLLRRALASLVAQTRRCFEVVLLNDGGERAAVEGAVAEAVPEALRPRIRLLHAPAPTGRWPAACAALAASSAPLVALLDDDDAWEPGFLAATVSRLSAPDAAGLVGVVTQWWHVEERPGPDGRMERVGAWRAGPEHGFLALEALLGPGNVQPQAVLFRRAALDRVGGWDPGLPLAGDWELHLRLMLEGDIAVVAEPLVQCHRRPGASGPLANSVEDLRDGYRAFHAGHRTRVLRAALRRAPELAGPLLLGGAADRERREEAGAILARLDALGAGLAELRRALQDAPDDREQRLSGRLDAQTEALAALGAGLAAQSTRLARAESALAGQASALARIEATLAGQAPVIALLDRALRRAAGLWRLLPLRR